MKFIFDLKNNSRHMDQTKKTNSLFFNRLIMEIILLKEYWMQKKTFNTT